MMKALTEKFKELRADEEFKKSLLQDAQAALATGVVILGLVILASLSGKGCGIQDLDSKTVEPGEYPTKKAEASSLSKSVTPPLPSSGSKGEAR